MIVRKWSNPERREGDKLLAFLPMDFYLMIFDEICFEPDSQSLSSYKSILAKLGLVCRLFSAILAPKLFAIFTFDGSRWSEDNEDRSPQAEWLEQVSEGEEAAFELAKYVKELSFMSWRELKDAGRWKSISCRNRFMEVLSCFSSVHTLSITRTPIPVEFFETIVLLPSLKTLRIKDCTFQEGFPTVLSDPISLTKLEVSNVENLRYYRSAFADIATTASLRSFKTSHWRLARRIFQREVDMPNLRQLDVPLVNQEADILMEFLNRTPSITELTLATEPDADFDDDEHRAKLDIHTTSLPNLKILRCPTYLLPSLYPKRPVGELNVVETQDWLWAKTYEPNALELLHVTKDKPLKRLDISFSMYNAVDLHKEVPQIDMLCVCFPFLVSSMPCKAVVRMLCGMHTQTPNIRSLKLHFFGGINILWSFNFVFQHQMVTEELSPKFPSAINISLTDALEWQFNKDAGVWKPVILAPEYFRSLLMADEGTIWELAEVEDYDGILAGLFSEDELTEVISHRLGLCGCSGSEIG